jgi:hypothetical protein
MSSGQPGSVSPQGARMVCTQHPLLSADVRRHCRAYAVPLLLPPAAAAAAGAAVAIAGAPCCCCCWRPLLLLLVVVHLLLLLLQHHHPRPPYTSISLASAGCQLCGGPALGEGSRTQAGAAAAAAAAPAAAGPGMGVGEWTVAVAGYSSRPARQPPGLHQGAPEKGCRGVGRGKEGGGGGEGEGCCCHATTRCSD